jgi:hypothetical protein
MPLTVTLSHNILRVFVYPAPVSSALSSFTPSHPASTSRIVFQWRLPTDSLLDIALDNLTLSKASLYGAVLSSAPVGWHAVPTSSGQSPEQHVTAAVDGLRCAGTMHHVPQALRTRAWYRAIREDRAAAQADLDAAWDLALRGTMPLYLADIHLYRARLFGNAAAKTAREPAPYPWGSPQQDLAEARRLIEKHGYHRRDEELADAEAAFA